MISHNGSHFSQFGASGKPGAVQTLTNAVAPITAPRAFPQIVNDSKNESSQPPLADAFPWLSPPPGASQHPLTLDKINVYELFLNRLRFLLG
jgi:hypothetical protein